MGLEATWERELLTHGCDIRRVYTQMPSTRVWPSGPGLSYTTLAYRDLQITPDKVDGRGAVEIACLSWPKNPIRS